MVAGWYFELLTLIFQQAGAVSAMIQTVLLSQVNIYQVTANLRWQSRNGRHPFGKPPTLNGLCRNLPEGSVNKKQVGVFRFAQIPSYGGCAYTLAIYLI